MHIRIDIGAGELIDKITILEIKAARITDFAKLRNVRHELETLRRAADRALPPSVQLESLTAQLRSVNEALWCIEDDIRACERNADFGPTFVDLARAVYRTNDRRAALKRAINELTGSALIEEKSYEAY